MMRALLALTLLGGLTWFLDQEQRSGRFQRIDEGFEDFLIANSRGRFDLNAVEPSSAVACVLLREQDSAEYASWPPPPLDWQILLTELAKHEPEVLVVAEPLDWGRPAPDFLPAVAEALLPFPSVVLAAEVEIQEPGTTPPNLDAPALDRLPGYPSVTGSTTRGWNLSALVRQPDEMVLRYGELGLAAATGDGAWPLTVVRSDVRGRVQWVPTLLAQTLSRMEMAPYGDQRIRLGVGAGGHVGPEVYVPLQSDGTVDVAAVESGRIPVINGLDLMTGGLVEGLLEEERDRLQDAKVIVVGTDTGGVTRNWVEVLARIDALPRVKRLAGAAEWAVWALAVLVGTWMVARVRRRRALVAAGIWIFVGFTASYLLFESQLLWCPPALPSAILLAAGLLTLLFGHRSEPLAEDDASADERSKETAEGGVAAPEQA